MAHSNEGWAPRNHMHDAGRLVRTVRITGFAAAAIAAAALTLTGFTAGNGR